MAQAKTGNKTMRNKELTMSTIQREMAKYNIQIVYYIDRLHFYTDSQTHKNKLAPILKINSKNDLKFEPLSGHEHLSKKVELFQPALETLIAANNIVSGDYAITYIELAIDFLVPNKKALTQLQYFFDRHLVHNRTSKKPAEGDFHFVLTGDKKVECKCKSTCICRTRYFTPESDKKRLAMYSDRPSKTDNTSPCVHIEKRFQSLIHLKKLGLYTLENIIQIDHEAFWQEHLDLRSSNHSELGRLNLFYRETGDRANVKRGQKQWTSINNLQEYLGNNSRCEPAFKNMSESKLEKYLQEYL